MSENERNHVAINNFLSNFRNDFTDTRALKIRSLAISSRDACIGAIGKGFLEII